MYKEQLCYDRKVILADDTCSNKDKDSVEAISIFNGETKQEEKYAYEKTIFRNRFTYYFTFR